MPIPSYYKRFGEHFLDDVIRWISSNLPPEDIFDNRDLDNWAKENGYVKEE